MPLNSQMSNEYDKTNREINKQQTISPQKELFVFFQVDLVRFNKIVLVTVEIQKLDLSTYSLTAIKTLVQSFCICAKRSVFSRVSSSM